MGSIVVVVTLPNTSGTAAFRAVPYVILVPAPMAADTIGEVRYSLLPVLLLDVRHAVFMAAVARIGVVVVGKVARDAFRIVIAIQSEISRVIEGGRRPCVRTVAA